MAGPRIDEVESNVFHVSSRINSTWGGNLVDMVRCARYLEIMRDEKRVEGLPPDQVCRDVRRVCGAHLVRP